MFKILLAIFKILLLPLGAARKEMLLTTYTVLKENEILKRTLEVRKKRVRFSFMDKVVYAVLFKVFGKMKEKIILVKPETVLGWYRKFIKKMWDFSKRRKKPGRPRTPLSTRELVLEMKNKNLTWGVERISGELLKLGIKLDKRTIANILADYRKKGKVQKTMSWSCFIQSHIKTLFAMDYFTVITIF